MVKVRIGEDFGFDMDQVVAWVLVKDRSCSDDQELISSLQNLEFPIPAFKVDERILLFTSGETLVLRKAAVGSLSFTKFHIFLLSLFNELEGVSSDD